MVECIQDKLCKDLFTVYKFNEEEANRKLELMPNEGRNTISVAIAPPIPAVEYMNNKPWVWHLQQLATSIQPQRKNEYGPVDLPVFLTSARGSVEELTAKVSKLPFNEDGKVKCPVKKWLSLPRQMNYFKDVHVSRFVLPPYTRSNYCRYDRISERLIRKEGDLFLEHFEHESFHRPSDDTLSPKHPIEINLKEDIKTLFPFIDENKVEQMNLAFNLKTNRRILYELDLKLAYLKMGLTPPEEIPVLNNKVEIVSFNWERDVSKQMKGTYVSEESLKENFHYVNMQPAIRYLFPNITMKECQLLNAALNKQDRVVYRHIFLKQYAHEQKMRQSNNYWTEYRKIFYKKYKLLLHPQLAAERIEVDMEMMDH